MNTKPYLDGFSDQEDVLSTFRDYDCGSSKKVPIDGEEKIEVLFAVLDSQGYEESAFVLWRNKDTGKLYSMEAGHCSCNGFDGQWGETETTVPALLLMLDGGWKPCHEKGFAGALRNFLAELAPQ